jgi:hypothetical protein
VTDLNGISDEMSEETTWKSNSSWEDNIKMNLKLSKFRKLNLFKILQIMICCWAFIDTARNFLIPLKWIITY